MGAEVVKVQDEVGSCTGAAARSRVKADCLQRVVGCRDGERLTIVGAAANGIETFSNCSLHGRIRQRDEDRDIWPGGRAGGNVLGYGDASLNTTDGSN